MVSKFTAITPDNLLADDASVVSIGGLTIENNIGAVRISGDLTLDPTPAGIAQATALAAQINAILEALQAPSAKATAAIANAGPAAVKTVWPNPFD